MLTEIFINNTKVDLIEDLPISLNYSIADIREPDKRNTSYSKTINLPGSKVNNLLFSTIFKVEADINNTSDTNFNPDFNPNLKATVIVYNNKIEVMRGFCRLLRILVIDKYRISYKVALFGELANLFTTIGDAELTELDFSVYNHTYNKTSIRNSWTATQGYGYYYPMVDYAKNNLINWNVVDFYPAIYLKEIIDKIFSYAGFTYSSSYFLSAYFKSLILPFNSEALTLSDATISARTAIANRATDRTWLFVEQGATSSFGTINFDSETTDTLNQYNTGTYEFTAANIGNYGIEIDFDVMFNYNPDSAAYLSPMTTFYLGIDFVKENTLSQITYIGSLDLLTNNNQVKTTNTFIQPNTDTGTYTATFKTVGVDLLVGEKLYVNYNFVVQPQAGYFYNDGAGTPVNGDFTVNIKNTSTIKYKPVDVTVYEGDTVDMNKCIPTKMKMRDLLSSVFKMANLYVDIDPNVSKQLNILPRNDFYSTTEYVDWTNKLDLFSPFNILPMGALDARTYTFKYDDDSDYYNETYKRVYDKNYGQRDVVVDNDFLKEKKETKLIFAPTPSAGQNWNNRVLPSIFKIDQNGNKSIKSAKVRVLFNGGLKNCTPSWNFIDSNGTTTETQYPYAGHLDDPFSSTEDLNFGVPAEIYWTGDIYYTNNNLYNKYHKKFIEEITDKNSKIIQAKFYLTPNDISTLDFRKKIFINGIYYRLNNITNYNPLVKGLTDVELIKIKEGVPFVATSGLVVGGFGEALDENENAPALRIGTNDNPNGNIIIGTNYVHPTAEATIVSGYNNVVGAYSSMVNILSSSGVVVAGGLSNVSVINTSGVTITQSNTHYVSGVQYVGASVGEYTPIATGSLNIDAIITSGTNYVRNGDFVSVNGLLYVDATSVSSTTTFYLTIPIASNFLGSGDLYGSIQSTLDRGVIIAEVSNGQALCLYVCENNSNRLFTFSFTYKVR